MPVRLLIAEDHALVREGLRATFERTDIEIIGEATTAAEAVRLGRGHGADVMLLDVRMPDGDGFGVLRELMRAEAKLAVLIYSQHERVDFQRRARALGARGYLTKRVAARELIDAVTKAGQGQSLWPPSDRACETP